MDDSTSRPEAWPAELRAESGSSSSQPIYVHTAPSTGIGWKISTIVLAVSTVVLSILLSGQLAAPLPDPVAQSSAPIAPSPSASSSAPPISDVSQLVGTLGFAIMQDYTRETGWPESITVGSDGVVTTAEGIELGALPDGCNLSYTISADGSTFTLTLVDKDGESAVFGPAS